MSKHRFHCKQNRTSPRKWEVWQADVEFGNIAGHKVRPVVVIGDLDGRVEILEVTSHEARYDSDVVLSDPFYAGLEHSSVVKCAMTKTVDKIHFLNRFGSLCAEDRQAIQELGY